MEAQRIGVLVQYLLFKYFKKREGVVKLFIIRPREALKGQGVFNEKIQKTSLFFLIYSHSKKYIAKCSLLSIELVQDP